MEMLLEKKSGEGWGLILGRKGTGPFVITGVGGPAKHLHKGDELVASGPADGPLIQLDASKSTEDMRIAFKAA